MNKSIRDIIERRRRIQTAKDRHETAIEREDRHPMRQWTVTGTVRTRDGGTDVEQSTEYACTRSEAWDQAVAHAAGTNYTPERVELATRRPS